MSGAACQACGTELAPVMLACPSCHSLVHAGRLRELARRAEDAAAAGDAARALLAWREALGLVPPESRQHRIIGDRIAALERPAGTNDRPPKPALAGGPLKRAAGLGIAAVVLLVTKGKFLVAGLLKLPTLLTMVAAAGVYWALWGWKFALGLVLTTYVHEMGHVAALVHYGVAASPPMFIPGLGAFVRLKQALPGAAENARVGLAGPLWGLGAAAVCLGVGTLTGGAAWLAIGQFTAFLNLFNLVPFWQLDGGRAFDALTRPHRVVALLLIGLAWWITREGLLVLLMLGAGWQVVRPAPGAEDRGALLYYVVLVWILAALTVVPVPLPAGA